MLIMPIALVCAVLDMFFWDVHIVPVCIFDDGTWQLDVEDSATGLRKSAVYATPDADRPFGYYVTYYNLW